MRTKVISVTNGGRNISVKEAMGKAFRRTGYKIKKGFSYYRPSVFSQLKTRKKVAVIFRPVWAILIVLVVCAAGYGVRWWSLLDSMFVDDRPIDRPGGGNSEVPVYPDNEGGFELDIIEDDEVVSGKAVPIYKKTQKDKNVLNILLLGSDTRVPGQRSRTDTMMVASYNKNTNSLSIVSLMRDSLVPVDGYGWTKLCNAYRYGGAGLIINTINDCFDLDVQAYVLIDFFSFQEVIDKIGGIDLYITASEAAYYGWNNGKAGTLHLDGEMALEHARNRHLGTDFGRTERQRNIIEAVYEKVSKLSLAKQLSLVEYMLTKVTTNLSKSTIISLATEVIMSGIPEISMGNMPFDGTWENGWYGSSQVLKIDFEKNRECIYKFIYESASETD